MRAGTSSDNDRARFILLWVLNLFLCLCPVRALGTSTDLALRNYCQAPPVDGMKPNLLLMIDNSSSMYDLAYTDPAEYCLDNTFDNGSPYPGYFDEAAIYSYNRATEQFEPATGPISGGSCNQVSTGYLCLDLTTSSKKLASFKASGRFLNWLTMSKLDIEKKVLTGGKFNPASGSFQAESRGCQGKRFIKMVGNAQVTFAVRGAISSESDYVYRASQGAMTRIEIYPQRYNKEGCLAVRDAWVTGSSLPVFQAAVRSCMGVTDTDSLGVATKGKIFSEIMSDCYSYRAGGSTYMPPDYALVQDCSDRVLNYYDGEPTSVTKNNGDDICGKNLYHSISVHGGALLSSGFLGECYDRTGAEVSDQCIKNTTIDFCNDMVAPTVTDPSVAANLTAADANLSRFILDAGVFNLGKISGTLKGQISAPAPTGLLQKYSSQINFGALVFNDNGAGSECDDRSAISCLKHCQNGNDPLPHQECYQSIDCDGETEGSGRCVEDPRTDGARIISYLNDPLGDHGAGGLIASIDAVMANSWTPLAESFYEAMGYFANRTDLRLGPADFDETKPPVKFGCQKNGVLMVTDGVSMADRAPAVMDFVAAGVSAWATPAGAMPASRITTDPAAPDPPSRGSYNLDDLAWIARNKNIANPGMPIRNISDYLSSYVVYTGAPCGSYLADGGCSTSDEGVPEKMMQLVASKGGGSMVSARKPAELESAMSGLLQVIGSSSSSATESSVLSTGTANGALFLQEQFYPNRSFDGGTTSASWIGEMQGLWYYLDPFLGSSGQATTIREDSDGDQKLNLASDKVVRYSFAAHKAQAQLYQDPEGSGTSDDPVGGLIDPDLVKSLWRAGKQLWARDLSLAPRTIYTPLLAGGTEVSGSGLMKLSWEAPDNAPALESRLLAPDRAGAVQLMKYLHGFDFPGDAALRSRALRIGGVPGDLVGNPRDKGIGVWKLGDIISSTPALQSASSLGSYHLPRPKGYGDGSYSSFIGRANYQRRGTVYVGANDGMLHAFRLGTLVVRPDAGGTWPATQKAALTGSNLGTEEWAFIPGNALPYLKYLKEPNYSHLNYLDGSITLADVSLGDPAVCTRDSYWNCPKDPEAGSNWRTVLVAGMGLGGASKGAADPCHEGYAGTCVKAPTQTVGLSSYFALDVTEQTGDGASPPPRLLWEFSPPGLGFATSGAAILKLNARSGPDLATHDISRNGRWFAVFASGPTGSIDCSSCQFLWKSDQNLKLFVVDLNAVPPLTKQVNYWEIDTGIAAAFGGSMNGAGIDTDRSKSSDTQGYYEDDALYLGYTRKAADGTWSTGGVLRLLTKESPDPNQWTVSRVIDGIGPVTSSVAKLQDRKNHNLWLYFGTGRYFYNQDDMSSARLLVGVKEPCFTGGDDLVEDNLCSAAPLDRAKLSDASADSEAGTPGDPAAKGWLIGLDPSADGLGSERVTASPSTLTGGSVFFTTFKPSNELCQQGTSYLWGVRYDSGGATTLNGKAFVPLSNGSNAEISLKSLSNRGGRRSQPMAGKAGGVKLVTNSGLQPVKKIIHIQER
jgi:type IV pilus assembly protein PilY1